MKDGGRGSGWRNGRGDCTLVEIDSVLSVVSAAIIDSESSQGSDSGIRHAVLIIISCISRNKLSPENETYTPAACRADIIISENIGGTVGIASYPNARP